MERWLSWSKAHDWKSCVPYKGTEGSNPSLSAKKVIPYSGVTFFIELKGADWVQAQPTGAFSFFLERTAAKEACVLARAVI